MQGLSSVTMQSACHNVSCGTHQKLSNTLGACQSNGGDPNSEGRLTAEQALADRTLLRLFQAALKAEKLGRALDLAALLALPQSLEGALRLARHHRCSPERIWQSPQLSQFKCCR